MSTTLTTVPDERIVTRIYTVRGKKVMLDADLADLYEVETKALLRAVKRNADRFPADFAFQLTKAEFDHLRYQIGTSRRWGGRRYEPYAFTEQGVAMLSGVLRSKRAIHVNVQIMRTFTKLRELLTTHADLRKKIEDLEQKYDRHFKVVFDAINRLLTDEEKPKHSIGFGRSNPSAQHTN